ncbi:MAG: CDP-alcohol phosphatidyltransferase family protein [Cellulomonadaceae bacterium]|nr:CDP-alcohol phosphatidyltransferase family protein [Cellulomonadaceae bacterium]
MAAQETRPGYRETVARLAGAQKVAARGAPAYSRYVNRRLGRYLAAWAFRAGLTPDGVTAISALFTFSGIAVLALVPPSWWSGVAITLLLVLGYAFDSADGQVARLRGGGSPAGEWLDHVVDSIKVVSMPLALAIGFYRFEAAPVAWLLVPLVSAVVSAVLFFAMILTEQLRRQAGTASVASDAPGRPSWLRSVLVVPTDYGLLCFSFLLLGTGTLFLVVYTFLVAATGGFLALALVKWHREMRGLAPHRPAGAPAVTDPSPAGQG